MSLWKEIKNKNIEEVKNIINQDKSLAYSVDDNGMTTLIASAKAGSLDLMQYFIKLGIEPLSLTPNGSDILTAAASVGSLECFEYSLSLGAKIDRKREDGTTVMIFAASGGNPEIIKKCIDAGLDVNERSKGLSTPLIEAAKKGSLESCKILIENGADATLKQKNGFSALNGSCISGNYDLFMYLTTKMPLEETNKGSLVHDAVIGNNTDIVEFLINNKFDLNTKVKGRYPIHLACMKGNLKMVRLLLDNGAKLQNCDAENTPLHYAAESDKVETFDFILSKTKDINPKNVLGMTPLLQAAAAHAFNVCKYIIAKGGDIFALDNKNHGILHYAATHCDTGLLDTLDMLSVDFNLEDISGKTPLFSAVECGNMDVIKYFVEEKYADLKKKDNEGKNLFHNICNNVNVCEYLLANGVDPAEKDENEATPLHYAAESGKIDIIPFFLSHGCKADDKDANGMTPVDLASDFGHIECFELLVDSVETPEHHE